LTQAPSRNIVRAYFVGACVFILAVTVLGFVIFCVPYVDPRLSSGHILASRHISNMKQLALAINMYMVDHDERMPAELDALLEAGCLNDPRILLRYPTDRRIIYKRLDEPSLDDIVCWEPEPHVNQHKWLIYLTRQHRYVVRLSLRIDDLREDEFQELALEGK